MSVDIEIREIADYENVCLAPAPKPKPTGNMFEFFWGEDQVLVPHVVIISLTALNVGLCVIDDKSIDEWVYRFDEWQDVFGSLLRHQDGRGIRVGREDFERYKGLRVNSSHMSRSKFDKHLNACCRRELKSRPSARPE